MGEVGVLEKLPMSFMDGPYTRHANICTHCSISNPKSIIGIIALILSFSGKNDASEGTKADV